MRLNLKKCTFRVKVGKFLGYIFNEKGIEASQEQIKAILDMPSPRSKKGVKKLNGQLAALNCSISRLVNRSIFFFKVLKKSKNFEWTNECEEAF